MIPREYSYIKLKPEQTISLRKNILTLEMDLLQLVQRIVNYKMLRKSETQHRVMLRKTLDGASKEIKTLISSIPQIQAPKHVKPKERAKYHKEHIEVKHHKERKELREIRSIKQKKRVTPKKIQTPKVEKHVEKSRQISRQIEKPKAQERKESQDSKSKIQDRLNEIKRRLSDLGVGV